MERKLIIDGNAVYELDQDCMRKIQTGQLKYREEDPAYCSMSKGASEAESRNSDSGRAGRERKESVRRRETS